MKERKKEDKVIIMKIKKCQITTTNLKEIVNSIIAKCRKTGRRKKEGEKGDKSRGKNE